MGVLNVTPDSFSHLGAEMVRVHDVRATVHAVRMVQS